MNPETEGDRMKTTILAASPVQQRPAVLSAFLDSLSRLDQSRFQLDYLFVDNNAEAESSALLTQFQQAHQNVTILRDADVLPYNKDEQTHYWNETLVNKVAEMKDAVISHALQKGYDYLFLIDSDLLVHPNTLQRLSEADKDVISNIFWTKWQPEAEPLPQVWMMDEYSFHSSRKPTEGRIKEEHHAFLSRMRTPGIYEVGGLGACTLISRKAMEQGARFRRLPNVSFWGEDRHFCIRAAALGISLFVDTRYPAYHIYRDADLAGVSAYRRSIYGDGKTTALTISLCMIVKNEEEALGRCLRSVEGVADEIIIVDTGSTDRTKEIAESFTANIFDFEWKDDFGAARNFAFSQATGDYILWLDADDVLLEEDRLQMLQLKATLDPKVDSVMMHYHLVRDQTGKPTVSLKRNRLVKRSRQYRWIGFIHEYLDVQGNVLQSDIAVTHTKKKAYTDRNLRIYRAHLEKGETLSPRDLYYYANELRDHAFYEEAAVQYHAFLATKRGWVEDRIAACGKLADCYGHMCEREQQFLALFQTMEMDLPRAENCCSLGALFLSENRLKEAVYWYEAAIRAGAPPPTGAMQNPAHWTWLPHLQLCVCYDRLGQYQNAYEHNRLALGFYPDHPSMLANRTYLEGRLGREGVV